MKNKIAQKQNMNSKLCEKSKIISPNWMGSIPGAYSSRIESPDVEFPEIKKKSISIAELTDRDEMDNLI
jgi:hypothetical protein